MNAALHEDLQMELACAALPRTVHARAARVGHSGDWDVGRSTMSGSLRSDASYEGPRAVAPHGQHSILLPVRWHAEGEMRPMLVGAAATNDAKVIGCHAPLPSPMSVSAFNHPPCSPKASARTSRDIGPDERREEHDLVCSPDAPVLSLDVPPNTDIDAIATADKLKTPLNSHSKFVDRMRRAAGYTGEWQPIWLDDHVADAPRRCDNMLDSRHGPAADVWTRFVRFDAGDLLASEHRFSLADGDRLLVRRDASSAHALVTSDLPIAPSPQGRHFEVQIGSIFQSLPLRRRRLDLGQATDAGEAELIIGVTATSPSEARPSTRSAHDVPRSWCIASSGMLLVNRAAHASPPPRRAPNEAARPAPRRWPAPWPDSERRPVDWQPMLAEGARVAFLVNVEGGVTVSVDDNVQLRIPDAGVEKGADLYLLAEIHGRVRSLRANPAAEPRW